MSTTALAEIATSPGPGFTYFARWVGRCKACKSPVASALTATEAAERRWACWPILRTLRVACGCGNEVTAKMVMGTESTKTCGARCLNATGPACDCSCGGTNHGTGH